jgi:uncharacterized protein YndB with AHSA1/START domain
MTATIANRATVTMPREREIHIERIVDAPRSRVWRAFTDPEQIAQWWGRGNKIDIEKHEPRRGGHWRYVEHANGQAHGFEGRFREVTPEERIVRSFEWDGMPAHVIIETMTLVDLGDGRTKVVIDSLFHTNDERDGFAASGMEGGMNESFAALDRLLAKG